ncbi:MAG TPA: hypothetical protein VMC10_09325 [Stellaceae bacterium]|nr:hypothetical protein [Stellaceae bacterium]
MAAERIKKAQKALRTAVREMQAALVANPLVEDPLMATAQVLEDLGEILLEAGGAKRKAPRAKPAKKAGTKR